MLAIPTREHYRRAYRFMRMQGVNHTLFRHLLGDPYRVEEPFIDQRYSDLREVTLWIIEAAHKSWQSARQPPPPNFHKIRCQVHFRREFNQLIEIG